MTMRAVRAIQARAALRALQRAAALLALALIVIQPARAQSLVRDEEIERYVEAMAQPIFEAGGLDPEAVRVYLINDRRLNAFVAGGQNLFLNTGLLARAETPDQLAGVIAHETGHIAGGHLSRLTQALENAAVENLIATALGVAAAVAGAPQVAIAVFAGGATIAERRLLKFSRAQEQAADLAAVELMRAVGRDPEGLAEFLAILGQEAALAGLGGGAEYLRSHPLTRNRVAVLRRLIDEADAAPPPPSAAQDAEKARHQRIRAKLDGFLLEADQLARRYGDRQDIDAHYARAIASFRDGDLRAAAATFERMIEAEPEDPFLHELLGQARFESGAVADAVEPYRRARALAPDSALIRVGLGRALVESGFLEEASVELREAVRLEPANAQGWRALGVALGRLGRGVEASLAFAEEAVLRRRIEDAELHLGRAEAGLDPNDAAWLRIDDLREALAQIERQRRAARR